MKKKRVLFSLALLTMMSATAMAQTKQSVTVDGTVVGGFVTGITFDGDNVVMNFKDGSSTTAGLENTSIDLNYLVSLSDADEAGNTQALADFGGKTVDVEVSCTVASGQWNTLCLPFAMTAHQISDVFGNGTKVAKYDKATEGNINFTTVSAIEAGVPYLIAPAQTVTSISLERIMLKNITKGAVAASTDYSFNGAIPSVSSDGKFICFANDNQLQKLENGYTIKPFHAYLYPAGSSKANTFSIDGVIAGVTAAIKSKETLKSSKDSKIFSIDGKYAGNRKNGLKRGIYIINGKKIEVK